MVDAVRKNTIEGTSNYHTVTNILDRSKEMLIQANEISKTLVPPSNQILQAPLGSPSQNHAAETKDKGRGIQPETAEDEVEQRKGSIQTQAQSPPASNGGPNGTKAVDGDETQGNGNGQPFFMDSKPTPVNFSSSIKRKPSLDEPNEANASKKMKKEQGVAPFINGEPIPATDTTDEQQNIHSPPTDTAQESAPPVQIEYEDISQEVDRRLRRIAERRKHLTQRRTQQREERKRKRESAGSSTVLAGAENSPKQAKKQNKLGISEGDDAVPADVVAGAEGKSVDAERKERKPRKKRQSQAPGDVPHEEKQHEGAVNEDTDQHKKKKVKTSKANINETKRVADDDAAAEGDEPVTERKKRRKKG
ncbi:MAG: hypothetical protein Q9220_000729 [cf. Caloplaca sp. 1 TL-2023]